MLSKKFNNFSTFFDKDQPFYGFHALKFVFKLSANVVDVHFCKPGINYDIMRLLYGTVKSMLDGPFAVTS